MTHVRQRHGVCWRRQRPGIADRNLAVRNRAGLVSFPPIVGHEA
jgi:hypothetical protein